MAATVVAIVDCTLLHGLLFVQLFIIQRSPVAGLDSFGEFFGLMGFLFATTRHCIVW